MSVAKHDTGSSHRPMDGRSLDAKLFTDVLKRPIITFVEDSRSLDRFVVESSQARLEAIALEVVSDGLSRDAEPLRQLLDG